MTEAFTQKPSVHRPPHAPATAADVMRPAPATIEPRDHVAAAAYLILSCFPDAQALPLPFVPGHVDHGSRRWRRL
jgi:hypothetical protein